jgi:hypothetical protein
MFTKSAVRNRRAAFGGSGHSKVILIRAFGVSVNWRAEFPGVPSTGCNEP